MRVTTNGSGTGGGHQDILIGDPGLTPFTINPEVHSNTTWPINFWHWNFSEVSAGSTGLGTVWTNGTPGDAWMVSQDGVMVLNSNSDNLHLTMSPTTGMQLTNFDAELSAQWQLFGITRETNAVAYNLASTIQLGWGVFPSTLDFSDGVYFEKHPADPKIYAVITEALGNHVDVDTGAVLNPGSIYKFAIRMIKTGPVWAAYFYIDDQLVYTNNATTLGWWPNTAQDMPWDAMVAHAPDGYHHYVAVKGPWIYMGR